MAHQFEITGQIESIRVIGYFGASFEIKPSNGQGENASVQATALTEGFLDALSAEKGGNITCSGTYDNNSFNADKIVLG